jgi:SAM-dependent methyltransferase
MSVETIVSQRYAEGARQREESLCCPVDYDTGLLALLPQEIIDRDYGCGDPSRYVREGDVVLDLGSGGGKICYMAAQLVGETGAVIGVDMTDDMLALARKHQAGMAEKLGNDRVTFKKGYIQDLALDLDAMQVKVGAAKGDLEPAQLDAWKRELRINKPMIADNSVSLVISNCVLNLVDKENRSQMISEIFRVLQPGGRVAISDIVSDELVPEHLQKDPTLWSGCISGAFHEKSFLDAFVEAGFVAVGYDKWDEQPWQTVEEIEFRSVTLTAVKPGHGDIYDAGQAVIYRGPYLQVTDDLGNIYPRGERIAVSRRTFELLAAPPYAEQFVTISPAEQKNLGCFCKPAGTVRPAAETKGGIHRGNSNNGCC